MSNTDKWPLIQQRYSEPLPFVLAKLLNDSGWQGAADEFDVDISTIGEYIKRGGVKRQCVYVVAAEADCAAPVQRPSDPETKNARASTRA